MASQINKKILICDDEEGVRESLRLILGDYYDLIITEDGQQCLECLAHQKDIKLVLLDFRMPQVSGLAVLKIIKKKYPKIKVIIVTGYRAVDIAADASQIGADGYVIKPFNSKEILENVQRNL